MRKLKALIVDDESEIRELILFYLMEEFEVEAFEAGSSKKAIEILQNTNPGFDVCISDYNMPGGNGNILYNYIRTHYPEMPFILSTSGEWAKLKEFHSAYSGYLEKPYQADVFSKTINALLKSKVGEIEATLDYIGVSLNFLKKLSPIGYPLFLKISDSNYLKISHQGISIDETFCNHYKSKKVENLYVLKNDYNYLIKSFADSVNQKEFLKPGELFDDQNQFHLASNILLFIDEAVMQFGWSKEIEELAKKNISLIISIIESKKSMRDIFNGFNFADQNYLILHSLLISLITTALIKETSGSDEISKMLTFAAFLHDIKLTPYLAENEYTLNQSINLNRPTYKEESELLKKHPQQAVDHLAAINFCPDLIKTIIIQHHEKIDGTGYPNQLKIDQINEFASVFMLAEELTVLYINLKKIDLIKNEWLKKTYLSTHQFKKYYMVIKNWLESE